MRDPVAAKSHLSRGLDQSRSTRRGSASDRSESRSRPIVGDQPASVCAVAARVSRSRVIAMRGSAGEPTIQSSDCPGAGHAPSAAARHGHRLLSRLLDRRVCRPPPHPRRSASPPAPSPAQASAEDAASAGRVRKGRGPGIPNRVMRPKVRLRASPPPGHRSPRPRPPVGIRSRVDSCSRCTTPRLPSGARDPSNSRNRRVPARIGTRERAGSGETRIARASSPVRQRRALTGPVTRSGRANPNRITNWSEAAVEA